MNRFGPAPDTPRPNIHSGSYNPAHTFQPRQVVFGDVKQPEGISPSGSIENVSGTNVPSATVAIP